MTPPAVVECDFEFGFTNGQPVCFTVLEGAYELRADPTVLVISSQTAPTVREEVTIERHALAYVKRTWRTLEPDVTVSDAGTVKVEGELPT